MNNVVKYHNNFNGIGLRNFNSNELNILMAICSRMKEKGEEEITFHFDKLKKLINYSDNTSATFVKDLESTYDKLISIKLKVGDERRFVKFVLFTRYSVDMEEKTVEIAVNKEFSWVLNELNVTFTAFELKEFLSLKSSYAKEFYRRMKQFKSTGIWRVSIEEFRKLLDISEKYKIGEIDKWVLKPIQKELGDRFNLKIKKLYNKKSRGRPSVSGFIFTFLKEDLEQRKERSIKNKKIDKDSFISYFLHRKVRMYDRMTEMFNVLAIESMRIKEDETVLIRVQNVDDMYKQVFEFESIRHFENWFSKYGI
ncbi:replication initiation protein [Leptotrichia wadei]|jgi:putative replication protein rep|uniref:Initiator RepB protein n=2 Tax=Leptotrichia wadei TaxID=157687 RepID=A0A510KH67_9FUSO|nr:replication initiation protein [Leptotrichia wadei]ERK54488.1 initiator RepB protein [Leptotrichia wadei F0279]BBM51029.1 initiator RepB protein [Leptotrichia wadei]